MSKLLFERLFKEIRQFLSSEETTFGFGPPWKGPGTVKRSVVFPRQDVLESVFLTWLEYDNLKFLGNLGSICLRQRFDLFEIFFVQNLSVFIRIKQKLDGRQSSVGVLHNKMIALPFHENRLDIILIAIFGNGLNQLHQLTF